MAAVDSIRSALNAIPNTEFVHAVYGLLGELGYESSKTLSGQSGAVEDFFANLPPNPDTGKDPDTISKREFLANAASAQVLFQITDDEIQAQASAQLALMDNTGGFDAGREKSFIFVAVELEGHSYSRGKYAQFTREINKRLSAAPTVVVFCTSSNLLTLAFVQRRPSKRDSNRSVLGSVSLIREIDTFEPHRAHLDILAELSLNDRLKWIDNHNRAANFDGLLAAWLDSLDTEELNKRFYRDLFGWFERAVAEARFPTSEAKCLPAEEHVIRLITRMLFVWFIKEKGLVAENLFVEAQVRRLLKDYDPDAGDSYYRAVLQNLFFATLNTEIGRRGFSSVNNATHRDFSRYRFRNEIADKEALLGLLAQTPFINGGLFDCLDSFDSTGDGGYRIDCFSDNVTKPGTREYRLLSIPNRLFFTQDDRSPGLIPLFNRYKFTVEENTPTEQEVALDPELLGKVFENLLAAYNPETRETARKQTGSYYTPRPVVDYMVEEALVESLSEKTSPMDGDRKFYRDRLHYLLDYEDAFDEANELFDSAETQALVQAIAEIKVLDPAVGSGAFPMGVLHKLTLALNRLDPDNEQWESLQRNLALSQSESAYDTQEPVGERNAALEEISNTFEKYRDSDFGRKLYLIQNSIFGVDIQPVATQIAKLRFFISLAIEQQPDDDPENNYDIKPLPNLETRFVAANTLLGLGEASQIPLGGRNRVTELNDELRLNRERHFHARVRQEKLRLRSEDHRLRGDLSKELRKAGMSASDAGKVANWDPYDQNASADWFDPKYMFGVADGFDVVIGNPPYIQLQKNRGELGHLYRNAGYDTFARTGDIYQLFYEKGCRLLTQNDGVLSYITSNSWLKAEYGKATRRYFADRHKPLKLIEMGKDVFENAIVDTSVFLLREGGANGSFPAVDIAKLPTTEFPPDESLWGQASPGDEVPWSILSLLEQSVMDKMHTKGTPLKEWDVKINRGILTGYNAAFIIDDSTRQALIAEDSESSEIIKPILRGRDIQRYQPRWAGMWLIATFPSLRVDIGNYPSVEKHLLSFGKDRLEQSGKRLAGGGRSRKRTPHSWFELQDVIGFHEDFAKEKLFWMDMSPEGRFAHSYAEEYCNDKVFIMTGRSLRYLCAILNSTLITWRMKSTALTTGMGLLQWKKFAVERLPIPKLSAAKQRPFIRLVDEILEAKAADSAADTFPEEAAIDRLVYDLYGLTEEESTAIERSLGLLHATDG